MAELIMAATGWSISGGGKNADFAKVFNALGVKFALGRLGAMEGKVMNKDGRVQDLRDFLQERSEQGKLLRKAAQSIRGKLQFMELQ
eukprot:4795648-Amphidinium_carterae.1